MLIGFLFWWAFSGIMLAPLYFGIDWYYVACHGQDGEIAPVSQDVLLARSLVTTPISLMLVYRLPV